MTRNQTDHSVLIIGASGALGSLVADAFRREAWTVYEAGRSPSTDPDFRYVDLAVPSSLPPAVEGMDLVVSTVPEGKLVAEKWVLRQGGLLLNLSAGPATALHALRGQVPANGTVVMNAGVAPGVTNLVAAALLAAHPDADEVQMVFTVSTKGSGGSASADFAHRGFTALRHHRSTRVELPEPFGGRRVIGFAEPDGGWLGPAAAGVDVSTYICLAERPVAGLMGTLNRLRLIDRLPRKALGSGNASSPAEASSEPVAHEVAVLSHGRRLDSRLILGSGDFRMAAASSVVFADALLGLDGGDKATPGAWYPEEVLSLDRVGVPLEKAGISLN